MADTMTVLAYCLLIKHLFLIIIFLLASHSWLFQWLLCVAPKYVACLIFYHG
jgi:hypothetical protein